MADFTGRSGVAILKFHSDAFAAAPVSSLVPGPAARPAGAAFGGRIAAKMDFAIPQPWHALHGEVAVLSPSGRLLGRASIDGVTVLEGGFLSRRFGGGPLMIKPARKGD